jgi:acetyl esterase/lipase
MPRTPLLLALVLLAAAPPAPAQDRRPEVVVERGLVFGKGGGQELKLDLARPKDGDGPFPVVLCLHGGGWVGGDRGQLTQTLEALARRGYVAASPDYRLAPKDHFPAPLEDCKAAVRWLRANVKKYNGDPQRIGALGFSAGGHLACLLGVTGKDDGLEGKGGNEDESSRVQAVVSFFGPTDLESDDWGPVAVKTNLVPLLGGTKAEKPELYHKASPLAYPCKDAPPFLFLHGDADKVVSPEQSKRLAKKLEAGGGWASVVLVEGEGHGWRGEALLKSLNTTMTFLDAQLKK